MSLRFLCLLAMVSWLQATPATVRTNIDWKAFLARHDLVWKHMTEPWYEAPFVGNGELGAMMRMVSPEQIIVDVGSNRVHDYRIDDLRGGIVPSLIEISNRGRLPIGHFELKPAKPVDPQRSNARIHLWNGEATGGWNAGGKRVLQWRMLAHAEENVVMLELRAQPDEMPGIRFVPAEAVNPRKFSPAVENGWRPNPPAVMKESTDKTQGVAHQKLIAGGETVTAWHVLRPRPDVLRLFWTVVHLKPGQNESPLALAKSTLERTTQASYKNWMNAHRAWWHAYYPQSFLSFGDPYWEAYYWAQIYKIGSATRADRPLIDNAGPWFQPTQWGATWWSMNSPYSYLPVYTANRLHLGESLVRHFHEYQNNLILSVDAKYRHDSAGLAHVTGSNLLGWAGQPGGRAQIERKDDIAMQTGNLLHICHNLWLHYRHSMDEKIARETLFPILRRAVNYYIHFLRPGADGKLNLPPTFSAEYGTAPNASYDIALLRWGAATLIDLNQTLKMEDPLMSRWQELLDKLVPYERDQVSYFIGQGVKYEKSDRYAAHLMMIYPLREVRPDNNSGNWIRSNLAHWHSSEKGYDRRFSGHSFTVGASLASITGDKNGYAAMLKQFKDKYINASTLYHSGGNSLMDGPLHMVSALQEAFLQSHHDHLAIFPCVPRAWQNVRFHRFLAQGGHLVSAVMEKGKPVWVDIESPHGGTIIISVPFDSEPHLVTDTGGEMSMHDDGKVEVTLAPGSRCQLTVKPLAEYRVQPAPALPGAANPFGVKSVPKTKKSR